MLWQSNYETSLEQKKRGGEERGGEERKQKRGKERSGLGGEEQIWRIFFFLPFWIALVKKKPSLLIYQYLPAQVISQCGARSHTDTRSIIRGHEEATRVIASTKSWDSQRIWAVPQIIFYVELKERKKKRKTDRNTAASVWLTCPMWEQTQLIGPDGWQHEGGEKKTYVSEWRRSKDCFAPDMLLRARCSIVNIPALFLAQHF